MKTGVHSAVLAGLAASLVEAAPQLFPRELVDHPRMVARDGKLGDSFTVLNAFHCLTFSPKFTPTIPTADRGEFLPGSFSF
jgi:hypothetical protein